uniref:Uncharacterized protein n=3 Tax=Ciona intestinalis TaxID=7719 RepID=F7AL14_CIOIN
MPVATGPTKEHTNHLSNSDAVSRTISSTHVTQCSVEMSKGCSQTYEQYDDSIYFTRHSDSFFQLPTDGHLSPPGAMGQPHSSHLAAGFDTREFPRRRLMTATEMEVEAIRASPTPCVAPRKSDSPTRKRLRTSSCNELPGYHGNSRPIEQDHLRRRVSTLKKRVSQQPTITGSDGEHFSLVDSIHHVTSSPNNLDLTTPHSSYYEPPGLDNYDITHTINDGHRNYDIPVASNDEIGRNTPVPRGDSPMNVEDFISSLNEGVPPQCMNPSVGEAMLLDENSIEHSYSNHGYERSRTNTQLPQQPPTNPRRYDSTHHRHPVVIGMDRMQYTSALPISVPVTMTTVPYHGYSGNPRTHPGPCSIPPRVVAFPTQTAPVLSTCTRPPMNLQPPPQQPQHIAPYPYHDMHHIYPTNHLPFPTVPISRPTTHPHLNSTRPTHVDHLVSTIGGNQRAIYPLPTISGQNRPISSTQPVPPQLFGYRGNILYREGQCGGLPSRQRTVPVGQSTYPHHVFTYGDASRAHYIRNRQMPIPYPGNLQAEHPRINEDAVPVGGAAQPPRAVAMPTTFMPAVPALYHHDYSVDGHSAQNGHRGAASSAVHAPSLHSHPIVMSPWNVPQVIPPLPQFLAFPLPTLPGFMFNPFM